MWIDDRILQNAEQGITLIVDRPLNKTVILGRSNQVENEVNVENCDKDGVSILKRLGGGGTVLLYPGCIVVSLGCWVKDRFENSFYFEAINNSIIESLRNSVSAESVDFSQRGISDICIGNKKFGGTSLFRSRNYLLYQASIIVSLEIENIDRYLLHPTKEPDYRSGRSHKDFLCGIDEYGDKECAKDIEHRLSTKMQFNLEKNLEDRLIEPVTEQIDYIINKQSQT